MLLQSLKPAFAVVAQETVDKAVRILLAQEGNLASASRSKRRLYVMPDVVSELQRQLAMALGDAAETQTGDRLSYRPSEEGTDGEDLESLVEDCLKQHHWLNAILPIKPNLSP